MEYSIIKDDTPQNTVKRIKQIFEDLKLETEEFFYSNTTSPDAPVTLRLHLKNHFLVGTNGKGTNIDNARASAYAEFIERLSNLMLIPLPKDWDKGYLASDKISFVGKIDYDNEFLNDYLKNKFELYSKIPVFGKKGDIALPFYSVKHNKVYNLPFNIVSFQKGSNGMAAGNTLEEAIVQGLSEICERYAQREIFTKKIKIPTIPKTEYKKYSRIKKMVDYLEEIGYDITIKDASLDGKLPVVCAILEVKSKNILYFVFGSHPSLPIAIERCITEFVQGINMLENINLTQYMPYYSKEKFEATPIENIPKSLAHMKIILEKNDYLSEQFFATDTDYGFKETTWIKDLKITNKQCLKFLYDKVLQIANDIFIRDVSFLGFPVVNIFVPNMCELANFDEPSLELEQEWALWRNYYEHKSKKCNVKSLLSFSEKMLFLDMYAGIDALPKFFVPYEYVAFLCSVVLKDIERIKKYNKIMKAQNKFYQFVEEDTLFIFNIITEYFILKEEKLTEKQIKEKLSSFYDFDYYCSMKDIVKNLNYDIIVQNTLAENQCNDKKLSVKRLLTRLKNKYEKNIQNQNELKNIVSWE